MTLTEDVIEPVTRLHPKSTLNSLLADFSIEATPGQVAKGTEFTSQLASGSQVYVPFLPGAPFQETVDAVRLLARAGMRPVPHLPARAIAGREALRPQLGALRDAGADTLLLIAGDLAEPAGRFTSTLDILETGLLAEYGFDRLGVAGHPEGHPVADARELRRAMATKAAYARETGAQMWLVTQFTFAADPVIAWLDEIEADGINLPVRVGLPGPAKLRTLISFALKSGVAASARMLAKRPDMANMLFKRWYPDEVLDGLVAHKAARPDSLLSGVHVYAFGGLKTSATWFAEKRDGIDPDASA